jgi:hypothetical protein
MDHAPFALLFVACGDMCCSEMPLQSEEEDTPFYKLHKCFDVEVIAHTHLLCAQQQLLQLAVESKEEALCRFRRFTSCQVLLAPSREQILQVRTQTHILMLNMNKLIMDGRVIIWHD